MRSSFCVVIVLLAFGPAGPVSAEEPSSEKWEVLYREGELELAIDESAAPPAFKAEGIIEANLFDLMAVLADVPNRKQWMEGLTTSRIVEGDIASKVVIYERYALPWPCEDRDAVAESTIHTDLQKLEVAIDYHEVTTSKAPVRVGVTRMPQLRGNMLFRYLDRDRSYAKVVIRLDVGGSLPRWAVNQFLREAPVLTLKGLTKQVKATRGHYGDFIRPHLLSAQAQAAQPFEVDPRSLGDEGPKK